MTGFLAELGAKLADRWMSLLLLPGLLWTATLLVGAHLGQTRAFSVGVIEHWLDGYAAHRGGYGDGAIILVLGALALASAAAGLAASGLGTLLTSLWVLPGYRRPLASILGLRARRWERVTTAARQAFAQAAAMPPDAPGYEAALDRARVAERRRARFGPRPQRPTKVGDCFLGVAQRVETAYGLDLDPAWPRLWAVLPEALRADLTAAQDGYGAAGRLVGWGLLYAALAVLWWPAVLLAGAVGTAGWRRARRSADVLGVLVETAVDLHINDLATALGLEPDGHKPATAATGKAINELLAKRTAPAAQDR